MSENLSNINWAMAWTELYKWFSENLRQDELDLMDSVLQGVIMQEQEDIEQKEG